MKMGQHKNIKTENFFKDNNNNNNNYLFNAQDVTINNIKEFYKDTKIFITGATGFVGKAVVEKLLRTCDSLDSIYILMRPKRGMAVEQRLKELFKNPVFNRIREKDPNAFEKVKIISGDVSMENLGLSENDAKFLRENIDVVLHSAATVKFNEDLKNAVILNTLGTKRVVDMCKEMRDLKSFVYVSTAYSNSDKMEIEEVVYDAPYDPNAIMSCVDSFPDDVIDFLGKKLLGKHPNTYTLTKAMAEHVVSEGSSVIPTCVVRPSIITSAWKEPYPGWVDNVSGITGIFMECGRGTIKSIICDDRCKMDLIPVDLVVNTIISAAWHTHSHRSNTMRVYNCTSGDINPITWKEFGILTHDYSVQYPSKYVTWYPGFSYTTCRWWHSIAATVFVTIPAAILDCYLYLTGQKTMMLKISNKFYSALEAGSHFSTNQWKFETNQMRSLAEAVHHAEDGVDFEVDMRKENGFNWSDYVKDFILGVRQYVLKDDISSLPRAKTKLNRLYWFQKIFQLVSLYTLFSIVMSQIL